MAPPPPQLAETGVLFRGKEVQGDDLCVTESRARAIRQAGGGCASLSTENKQSYTKAVVVSGSPERLELVELHAVLRAEFHVRRVGPRVVRPSFP